MVINIVEPLADDDDAPLQGGGGGAEGGTAAAAKIQSARGEERDSAKNKPGVAGGRPGRARTAWQGVMCYIVTNMNN